MTVESNLTLGGAAAIFSALGIVNLVMPVIIVSDVHGYLARSSI